MKRSIYLKGLKSPVTSERVILRKGASDKYHLRDFGQPSLGLLKGEKVNPSPSFKTC